MKSPWMMLAAFFVAFSLTILSVMPEKSAVAAKQQASGDVVMVDSSQKTLVIRIQGPDPSMDKEVTFEVSSKAEKVLPELKPGDRVSIQFTEADGKLKAESIKKG